MGTGEKGREKRNETKWERERGRKEFIITYYKKKYNKKGQKISPFKLQYDKLLDTVQNGGIRFPFSHFFFFFLAPVDCQNV